MILANRRRKNISKYNLPFYVCQFRDNSYGGYGPAPRCVSLTDPQPLRGELPQNGAEITGVH